MPKSQCLTACETFVLVCPLPTVQIIISVKMGFPTQSAHYCHVLVTSMCLRWDSETRSGSLASTFSIFPPKPSLQLLWLILTDRRPTAPGVFGRTLICKPRILTATSEMLSCRYRVPPPTFDPGQSSTRRRPITREP